MKTIKILMISIVFLSTTISVAQKTWSNNRYTFNNDQSNKKLYLDINDNTPNAVEFLVGSSIDYMSFEAPSFGFKGNLGVGITNPSEKLQVVGNVKATQFIGDGSRLANLVHSGDFGDADITTHGVVHIHTTENDALTIQTPDNTKSNGIAFQNSGTSYTWNIFREDAGSNNADLVFASGKSPEIDDLSEKLRITTNGKLGIGTSDPTEKLEVAGNVKATQFIGDGSRLTNLVHSGDFGDTDITTDGHVYIRGALPAIPSSYGVYIGNHNDVHTPVLDLVGNVDALIDFTGTSSDFKGRINYNYNDDAFYVHTKGMSSPALIIDDTQKTTIGSTYGNNNTKLDVKGFATLSHNASDYLRLGHGGSNSFIEFNGAGNLDFRNSGTTKMTFSASGNLGLGTSSPSEKLEVAGNVKAAGINLEGDGANTNTIDSNINGTIVFGGEDGSTLTNAQIADSFYPDFAVWVEEGIVAEDIAVAPSSEWDGSQPDYVFENDYELPSLEDVEAYVTSYKHLEGIPSKAEVAEKGWSLPNMDQKLLKKVEELTLYTIQQEKEIKALKALVDNLVETIKN